LTPGRKGWEKGKERVRTGIPKVLASGRNMKKIHNIA